MERDFHFNKGQIKKERKIAREMGLTWPAAGVPETEALYKLFGIRIRGRNFQSSQVKAGTLPEGKVRMEFPPPHTSRDPEDELLL